MKRNQIQTNHSEKTLQIFLLGVLDCTSLNGNPLTHMQSKHMDIISELEVVKLQR